MGEDDAVWAETTAGGLLRQLFGAYPSLHDASVSELRFNRISNEMTFDVDYDDRAAGDTPLRVRMRLIWKGLQSAELNLNNPHLDKIEFLRKGELLETRLESGFGMSGVIVSEGFEAVLDRVDPPDREAEGLTIRYG